MASKSLNVFPRGWFVISFSNELTVGAVKPLRYFAQDLVLFRSETGKPAVLSAHCPHLGAHLGYGGEVCSETLRCPFHAWTFDGGGRCNSIPYAKKIPKNASIQAWPVLERNQMIYLYHDPDGGDPEYDIPEIEECSNPEWSDWDHSILQIKTHPREIVENVADLGHFIPVHGTHAEHFENDFEGHIAIQRNRGKAYPRGGGVDEYKLTATCFGPGYQVTEMDGVMQSKLVNAHTPIDENNLHLRFAVSLRHTGNVEQTRTFSKQYIDNLRTGFLEDVAIWEHKVYRPKPILCDGDGPIPALRHWYQQFYISKS